jgi:adenylate cyclase
VRHALEGSVRKAGNRVRITAQLIDCATGGHVWAQRYDRDLTDIFAIQDEITHAIVVAMQVKLTDGEVAHIGAGGTQDLGAWELFLQGVKSLLKYTKEDMAEARRLFERALLLDSAYLDAQVYLAWTHWIDARYGDARDRGAAVAEARRLLDAAKAVDGDLANVLHLDAALFILERHHNEALAAAKRAVEAGPCKHFGYTPSALIYMYCGDVAGCLGLLRTTVRLSPFCPSDAVYYIAYALVWLGRVEEAVAVAGEYARRVPADRYAYALLAIANISAGDREAARAAVRELLRLYPEFDCAEFSAHELYRDPADLARVVRALRDAGLPD